MPQDEGEGLMDATPTEELRVPALTAAIGREVHRAMELHRSMHSLHEAYAVIQEELDEFWDEVKGNPKKLSVMERQFRISRLRDQLIQTAAMCVRTIVDLNL